jgi:hypothetical protein
MMSASIAAARSCPCLPPTGNSAGRAPSPPSVSDELRQALDHIPSDRLRTHLAQLGPAAAKP